MRGKNKITLMVIALIVVVALGYGGYRFFSPLTLAEGYLYEDEARIVYAKVTLDQNNVNVEVLETKVETEDSIPELKSSTLQFSGTIEGGNLNLKPQAEGGQEVSATVSADELVFLGPIVPADPKETKLLASQMAVHQNKLQALTTRVNEEAEVKKKEVAERRAKEAERVQFAKKVEQSTKLAADLTESATYLNEIQFAEETSFSKEQVTELQGLLDELTLYSTQTGLKKTEYEVMQGTAGSMKVLLDGMNTMDATIQEKKKRMTDLIAVLETDIADSKAVWEEIKDNVTDAQKREQTMNQSIKAATQAVEQAKQRLSAIEKEQAALKQSASKLYQDAVGVLSQTKTKYAF